MFLPLGRLRVALFFPMFVDFQSSPALLQLFLPGLPHSLLLVCSSPLVLAVAYCLTCRPISWGEIGGVALGTGGAALLALSAKSDHEVTVQGDAAAFLAAAAFCVYITCGKSLRGAGLVFFSHFGAVSKVTARGQQLEGSYIATMKLVKNSLGDHTYFQSTLGN